MNFLVSFNDVKPILYTFFGTIGLMVVFMGVAYLAKFLSDKIHSKKNDKDKIKSEVYRLIYENNFLTKDDLIKYLDCKPELIEEVINELLESNTIVFDDKKYSIKKEEIVKDEDSNKETNNTNNKQ